MQSFKKIDHSWWLVLTAAALLILGFTISKPSFEGVKGGDLIFWGILSGFIYSLANANDKRAIKGRKPVSEKAIYKNAIDYMALGGLIAIILTWISLFLLYGFFAPKAGYDVNNVMDDIKTAIFLNFKLSSFPVIDEVNIPFSFLGTGFFTIALTLATFKIFELKGLANYAIWLAISMFINLFIGRLAFNENIPNWGLLLFLIFLSFIVFYLQPPDPDKDNFNKINNNDNAPQELPYWAWGIIFVIFNSFREVFVRGS